MIYPAGASRQSGCLRVIPGSHRNWHYLHEVLPQAHTAQANALPEDHDAYRAQLDEVNIEVGPADIVICDVRLLHATHANATSDERPCITLWYLPSFRALPIEFKKHYQLHPCQPSRRSRRKLTAAVNALCLPEARPNGGDFSIELARSPSQLYLN